MSQLITNSQIFILCLGTIAFTAILINRHIYNRFVSLLLGSIIFAFITFCIGNAYEYLSDPELWSQKMKIVYLKMKAPASDELDELKKQVFNSKSIDSAQQNLTFSLMLTSLAPIMYLFIGPALYAVQRFF